MVRLTLRLSPAVSEGVSKIARNERKSKNRVIVEACEKLISKYKTKKAR